MIQHVTRLCEITLMKYDYNGQRLLTVIDNAVIAIYKHDMTWTVRHFVEIS